ncbi:collagen binding domain-containing protein [Lysinibacillus sp. 1P01SD]|uniref:collagen binding domain-containing protein n=1 Tax=Lysinibacillus sp. 1P01SD TaxID=3132285 RepID=UPI0039A13A04
MKNLKKLNIAIILLLLVFQTVLSPISVFAAEGNDIRPIENTNTGSGTSKEPELTNEAEPVEQPTETPAVPEGDASTDNGAESTEPSQPSNEEVGNDSEPVVPDEEGATETGEDTDTETDETDEAVTPEEEQLEEPMQADTPMPLAFTPESMQADISMSFKNLILNGTPIRDATDLANYSGPKPRKGDQVTLNYSFAVDPTKNYGVGSTFTFQLPANMIEEFTSGSFNVARTTEYASYHSTYDSATKTVTVFLDSDIEEAQAGNITFDFVAKFGNFADEEELEQTLIIPIEGGTTVNLPFEFAPLGNGDLLKKSAAAIKRDANGKVTIPWTVWVNTGGEKLNGASLNDVPDIKHALTGDITVERYKVGLNGFNPNSPGTPETILETAFPINLTDGNYAYKVTYNTVVTADPTDSSMTYKNTATLIGTNIPTTTADGTQTVQYGPSLDKARTGDKYRSEWTIKYNWLGQKIPAAQAILTDTLTTSSDTTGKHKIDYTSFKVYRVTLSNDGQTKQSATLLTKGKDYTLTEDDYDFKIDFDSPSNTTGPNGEVTSAFKIVYNTELEDEFVTDANQGTVTNTVTRGDGGSDIATVDLTPEIFNKSRGKIDYGTKTIDWTLTIKAEKNLDNLVIEDDFTTTNKPGDTLKHTLTQWSDSTFYNVTGAGSLDYAITDKSGNAPAAGNEGFKVTFSNTIPAGSTITINYKTKFDIKPNGNVATMYRNLAEVTWDGVESTGNQASRTADYSPNQDSPTNNNGYKKVKVNNNTQEFAWRVGININKQDIDRATLTDTLGAGHYIPVPNGETLKEQITITRLNLTTEEGTTTGQPQLDSSKWTVSETVMDGKVTGFVITFSGLDASENNEAYLVEYTSKDADDIYGQSSGNASQYTNSAVLDTPHNGNYTYNAIATISNHANELITKSAAPRPAADIIEWTVTVNASNSKLGNIVLTDKPSANQKVLTNSFKKQEIKLNEKGDLVTGNTITINENEIVINPDGSFSIDLGELNDKGYIVTYSTFFMGDGNTGETISNVASIGYAGASAAGTTDQDGDSKLFKYSSSDSTASATRGTIQLNKFKVNPLSGVREVFEGVTFELWNKDNTVKLAEGVTDANGRVAFEQVRYGKYTLREVTPTGYEVIQPFAVTMNAQFDILVGGEPYVVENIESVTDPNACPKFTITVNDANGNPISSGKDITLLNSNGIEIAQGSTDANGQFTVKRPDTGGSEIAVQAGLYTVEVKNGADSIVLENAKITVKYGDDCKAEVQQAKACPSVTITINDENNSPRTNVTVTVKDSNNAILATEKTDNDGKFILPSTTPAGTYKVYEGKQYLGTVTIDYTTGCEVELTIARACETFTLTINDVDGKPRENVAIEIVDKQNSNKAFTGKTDVDGEVVFDNLPPTGLPPAEYEVYENGKKIDEFAVDTNCAHTIQPAPACPQFTVELKGDNDILVPASQSVVIKDKSGNIIPTSIDADGRITFVSQDVPAGMYDVFDIKVYLGEIEVSYKQSCQTELQIAPACPDFTLTINNAYGQPRAGVKVTITGEDGIAVEENGSTEFTTDSQGQIVISNSIIKPGKYVVKENGETIIGTITVGNTCEATIQPSRPVTPPDPVEPGNPGPNNPDPNNPVDPNKPDPNNPVDPNKPDSNNPVDPNKPNPSNPVDPNKPDPNNPVDPNKPNPNNPVDPNKPDPSNPVDPNKPDPNNPVDPNKPDPSKPSNPTPGPDNPSPSDKGDVTVQDVINQGQQLPGFDPSNATKQTLKAYQDFLNNYNKLSKEDQSKVAQAIDINKIKADAERLESLLNSKGKLPQTDGADQTAFVFVGLILVIGALLLMRRRQTKA